MTDKQFPEIYTCIICELVRGEDGGKNTILGFFGVSPDVDIMGYINRPMSNITFFLIGGKGQGSFHFRFDLVDPNGNSIVSGSSKFSVQSKNNRLNINIGLQNVPFPSYGEYVFNFFVDEELKHTANFMLSKKK